MAITKKHKQALVDRYRELVQSSQGIVLASFTGLTVKELETLRRRIRELGGEFHVVQNRLAALALKEAGLSMPAEALQGSTAVGFAAEDPLAIAKAIAEFGRDLEGVRIKGGMIGGLVYSGLEVQRLAELPPLPVLRSRLLGLIQTPGGRVARALASSVRQVASVLKAYSEQAVAA